MARIEVAHLYKIFGPSSEGEALAMAREGGSKAEILQQTQCTLAVRDASFNVQDGETFVIMGLSGSGKSTVLRCLNRLIEPTAGEVTLDDDSIIQATPQQLRRIRREKLAMVFQHFGLLPHRSVLDNVAFGLEIQGVASAQRRHRAAETIELVGLADYAEARVQALSGGMQQRVGLARALATDATVLLMDEAFSALDPLIRDQMQEELLALQRRLHKTIVFITHDLDEALKLGDRIAIMNDGAIVQTGTPEQILLKPASKYVRDFVENVNYARALTASAVMDTVKDVMDVDTSPDAAVRQMERLNRPDVLVSRNEHRFAGWVRFDRARDAAQRGETDLRSIVERDVPTARPETPIANLLAEAGRTGHPVVVLDEQGCIQGVLTPRDLLLAAAGESAKEDGSAIAPANGNSRRDQNRSADQAAPRSDKGGMG